MKRNFLFFLFSLGCNFMHAQTLYFPPNFSFDWETVTQSEMNWCDEETEEFNIFLEQTNTRALIILKDGKIAMESYFGDHEMDTPWYWASAGKSLTAVLTGIAQSEGIVNINNPTSEYLGEGWTSCSPEQEIEITVKQQLTMTTGLDYTEDINCTDPTCLQFLNEPDQEWYYHNAPYTLLADVIANASGQTYTSFTNDKLASKIGFLGLWNSNDDNQLFFSTARGMARFGLFMLANGEWDGEQILEGSEYYTSMLSTSQPLNRSYGYLWWLNGKESFKLPGSNLVFDGSLIENAPDDLYAAIGKNGQICMVVPSQNLVIVRMGDNPDSSLVPLAYLRELWSQYLELTCSTNTKEVEKLEVDVWPRMTTDILNFRSNLSFDRVDILDRSGRVVMSVGNVNVLEVSSLRSGFYFARMISDRQSITKRFFKLD